MSALADVLERLHAAARAPMTGGLDVALSPEQELAPLIETTAELERAVRHEARPTRSALAEAREAWANAGGRLDALTSRQIRALCWDPDVANSPLFVRAMAERQDLSGNRRWLEGMVECYLAQWRTMAEPHALEELLRRAVGRFAGGGERLQKYRAVAGQLFSKEAPTWMGSAIIADRAGINETLAKWGIEPSTQLGEAVATAAVDAWTAQFLRERSYLHGGGVFEAFRRLTQELLTCELVAPQAIARAVSAMILWDRAEADEQLHQALLTFLLDDRRFRDPRLPNCGRIWALCETEARLRVTGWLAKGDLLFFFKFVIQHDPHGRRDFWLRYINRAVDANVALSPEDAYRLRAQVRERLSYSQIPGAQTSAFLMRFHGATGDILCIEFAETGNALYVHDADKFVESFGGLRRPRFDLRTHLKSYATYIDKFTHNGGTWQYKVQSFLARRGIRPA